MWLPRHRAHAVTAAPVREPTPEAASAPTPHPAPATGQPPEPTPLLREPFPEPGSPDLERHRTTVGLLAELHRHAPRLLLAE